jgi:hypothetical protein
MKKAKKSSAPRRLTAETLRAGLAQLTGDDVRPREEELPQKSWVIWFKDGRYSYAWGATPDAALESWLANFKRGVRIIVYAGEYKSALPVSQYLREINGQV